jgi:hypothetical protein
MERNKMDGREVDEEWMERSGWREIDGEKWMKRDRWRKVYGEKWMERAVIEP